MDTIPKMKEGIITYLLIISNTIVYILCAISGDLLYNVGDFSVKYLVMNQQWYRLISAVFLHVDLTHLCNNLLLLFVAGILMEKHLGHIYFLLLYLVSGVGGNGASALYELVTGVYFNSVGASGAVFGLLGAVCTATLCSRGRFAGITYRRLALMVLLSLTAGINAEKVNNMAHIGGFLSGALTMLVLYLAFRKRKVEMITENIYEN